MNGTVINTDPDTLTHIFSNFVFFLKSISKDRKIFIISNIPIGAEFDPVSQIDRNFPFGRPAPQRFDFDRDKFLKEFLPIKQRLEWAAIATGATLIDPLDFICPENPCRTTRNGLAIYKDARHLRSSYAQLHATFVDEIMQLPLSQ